MRRGADFMFGELEVELGMLFCLPRPLPFYRALGWMEAGTVWIGQPTGRMRWPESAMVLPRPGAAWHDGELDVRGLPW
jgi:hypothetical protein